VLQRETLEVVHDLEGVMIRSLSGEPLIQIAGQRYKSRRLHDRDELQVGTTRLLFEEPAQHAIDALKGVPDAPLPEPATIEKTATAPSAQRSLSSSSAKRISAQPAAPVSERTGPSLVELVIYALAIAVLVASGIALTLLLRAR
jgi:hypothetical protein